MTANLTLEGIEEVESLHKTDFYKIITGQECPFNFGSTRVHPWTQNVRQDNMNQIMRAVEKLENCHGRAYSRHTDTLRQAYEDEDYDTFQQEIGELLVSICWD